MLTTSLDVVVVFFLKQLQNSSIYLFASQGSFGQSFERFFFSASKLMLDCCLRVGTLYMLLYGKHLIINLV